MDFMLCTCRHVHVQQHFLFVWSVDRILSTVVTWSASFFFSQPLLAPKCVFCGGVGGGTFLTCIYDSFMVDVIRDLCQATNSSPLWNPLKSHRPHKVVGALLSCRKRPIWIQRVPGHCVTLPVSLFLQGSASEACALQSRTVEWYESEGCDCLCT